MKKSINWLFTCVTLLPKWSPKMLFLVNISQRSLGGPLCSTNVLILSATEGSRPLSTIISVRT